jgi:hypothetical protein
MFKLLKNWVISKEEIDEAIQVGHMVEKGAMGAMKKHSNEILNNI